MLAAKEAGKAVPPKLQLGSVVLRYSLVNPLEYKTKPAWRIVIIRKRSGIRTSSFMEVSACASPN